jgi:ornithine decarboxylase
MIPIADVAPYKNLFEELGCEYMPIDPSVSYKKGIKNLVKHYTNYTEEPFYIVDLSVVVRQVLRWQRNLPMVGMRYAVKCNPNPAILRILEHMGMGFDCASMEEIKAVLNLKCTHVNPETGTFDPRRIIFANPCKQPSHMRYAREVGVEYTTLDNEEELLKLKRYWPEAKCVIRIATDDSNSLCKFSSKFGANMNRVRKIIKVAKEHGMHLAGVSFHVGSGCQDSESFVKAIRNAKKVFDVAEAEGFQMHLLDIGGGFPGYREDSKSSNLKNSPTFEDTSERIRACLEHYFPEGVQFIGEPGRYIAAGTSTLAVNVFSKRDCRKVNQEDNIEESFADEGADQANGCSLDSLDEEELKMIKKDDFLYYVSDGIYGSFNNIFFDHYVPKVNLLDHDEPEEKYLSTIFGPTCDSMDVICKHVMLPELKVGDWMYFTNFGSYTTASASGGFNGFKTTTMFYIWRQ